MMISRRGRVLATAASSSSSSLLALVRQQSIINYSRNRLLAPAVTVVQSSSPWWLSSSCCGYQTISHSSSRSSSRGDLQQQSGAVVQKPWPHYQSHYYQYTCIRTKKTKANKSKKGGPSSAFGGSGAGRVAVYQDDGGRKKSGGSGGVKLCSGCGCRILAGSNKGETQMMGGMDVSLEGLSKRQAKFSRYLDVTDKNIASGGDPSSSSSKLCERCKALNDSNIWKAYDALRDVQPEVFFNQLKFVVTRRKFGMGIVVLDATDSHHSMIRQLRKAVGKIPLICVWNKIDLLPRFDRYDQKSMENDARKSGIQFVANFAVSAKTGRGIIDLAEYVLQNLGGRDVFVLGAANVGKSTLVKSLSQLIADNIYLRGKSTKQANRRRDQTTNQLQVTGSHLPGTTLQAVRIPCFSSNRHALWDTPGILNPRALQYNLFPAHLMEPLTRPGKIEVPTRETGKMGPLKAGYTILIESTWMSSQPQYDDEESSSPAAPPDHILHDEPEECVLARIDLTHIDPSSKHRDTVFVQAYLHPSLRVRVVPTNDDTPTTATIPSGHIKRIQTKIQSATTGQKHGLRNDYSLPLKPFKGAGGAAANDNPNGEIQPSTKELARNGKYYMDIVFASLGWISFSTNGPSTSFTVIPHSVKGSIFSKRKSIYPVGMLPVNNNTETETDDYDYDEEDLEIQKRRLRDASKEGRHHSDRGRRFGRGRGGGGEVWYDDYDDDLSDWY